MLLAVNTLDNVVRFISVLLLFIFVLFITFFSTKFIANFQKTKMTNSNVKVIEVTRIAQNKFIEIVKIGNKYFAIAVGKDDVNLLTEIPKEEIKEAPEATQSIGSFKDVLDRIKSGGQSKENTESEKINDEE